MVSLADISISRGYEADHGPDEDISYMAMESVFTAPEIGRDERRMQVRAYNHWLAALQDGELPAIEELRPERLDDLGPSGVLVDFTLGLSRPAIIFLGDKLAAECGEDREIFGLGDVPERSLLSRLTEHCLDVVANRAPIGFDAEFVNRQGQQILYRSMLMPYSSDGWTIDFVFGVISWKEGDSLIPATAAMSGQAMVPAPRSTAPTTLADLLLSARQLAGAAMTSEQRSHRALYAAIARLRDCAVVAERDPQGLVVLLERANLPWQERAPLAALTRLAFGPAWPRARLSEIATVLGHAARRRLDGAALEELLAATPNGIKGLVGEERRLRRGGVPAARNALRPVLARKLRHLPTATGPATNSEFALLVARRNRDGTVSILGDPGSVALLEKSAKRLILP